MGNLKPNLMDVAQETNKGDDWQQRAKPVHSPLVTIKYKQIFDSYL